jgi:hypothetical protein
MKFRITIVMICYCISLVVACGNTGESLWVRKSYDTDAPKTTWLPNCQKVLSEGKNLFTQN